MVSGVPVFVCLTPGGLALARRLRAETGGDIHVLAGRATAGREPGEHVFEDMEAELGRLFAAGRPIIGICAAGILIRLLAPRLADKRLEPPVLALAEDGSAVAPLLGGHHGGNDLARRLAGVLAVAPAITTAGEARFALALDNPPPGWTLANPADAKAAMAALMAGAATRIEGDMPWAAALPAREDGAVTLTATHERTPGGPDRLVYHPRVLAIGAGCERGCNPNELVDLVDDVLTRHGLAPQSLACLVSLDLKADEPAMHALAARLKVPFRVFDRDALAAETARLASPSEIVAREVGLAGVAEAAALAAVGPQGRLIVDKVKSARATCAVALAPAPIGPESVGRARGRLAVVGIGPGGAGWLSPEAAHLLARADDWVGYGLYLDLVAPFVPGTPARHEFALGEEEARVRHALELAGAGRDVALVSSGDAGIYAMAALACELMDPGARAALSDAARRVELIVAPGISAFQAAAARLGAPFGHDFCLISLSDLLTPWEVIEARICAAARGDFALAFYNPKSRRRADRLARALAILARHRPGTTPVAATSNLGRPGERVSVTTLDAFDAETVDMLTLVIVGASTTRAFTRGDGTTIVYTPRGYAAKREGGA